MPKVTLKKCKPKETEFPPVYFSSTTKIVKTLENAFQEILYKTDNWINGESGWIVELIESQYINISSYRLLLGSSCIKLPVKLRSPKKGLINNKNKNQKCFLWCHVRHLAPVKIHQESISQTDEELANDINYDRIEFLVD